MLKLATAEDENDILDLVRHFYSQTSYSKDELNEDKVKTVIRSCSDPSRTDNVFILWMHEGKPVGMLAAQATEMLTQTSKVASELVFWVEPEHRKTEAAPRLLEAFEFWAGKVGCDRVQLFALQNDYIDAMSRFYNKKGYKLAELSYVKEL